MWGCLGLARLLAVVDDEDEPGREGGGAWPGLFVCAPDGGRVKGEGLIISIGHWPVPCCPMAFPAVLLNSLFRSSTALSVGSTMMVAFASTVRFASRFAAVSSLAVPASSLPMLIGRASAEASAAPAAQSAASGSAVAAMAFLAASCSAVYMSRMPAHLKATVSYSYEVQRAF